MSYILKNYDYSKRNYSYHTFFKLFMHDIVSITISLIVIDLKTLLLGFTTLLNILGHLRCFRHRA